MKNKIKRKVFSGFLEKCDVADFNASLYEASSFLYSSKKELKKSLREYETLKIYKGKITVEYERIE